MFVQAMHVPTRRLQRLLSLLLLPVMLLTTFGAAGPVAQGKSQLATDPGIRYSVARLLAPTGQTFFANDLNDPGQIAGQYEDGILTRAGIWQNGSVTTLDSFGGSAVASGINNSG